MMSLVDLCRNVVVSNLERYPPEAYSILDEEEWENIIELRHQKTRPQKGKGGLDGTGRMHPAVGDKFMLEIEDTLPHFATSTVVDSLVWKDIVEYRFRVGGLSRPNGLMYPWPVLESMVTDCGNTLIGLAKQDTLDDNAKNRGIEAIQTLCKSSMDVSLLKSTGVGKAVKKFIKACSSNECLSVFDEPLNMNNIRDTPRSKLEEVLTSWMQMAASSGVQMSTPTPDQEEASKESSTDHLDRAKRCNTWRQLFVALKENDEIRRSNQGARMRERRERLDSVRPKIVKVRHATKKHNAIINRERYMASDVPGRQKMVQLRKEATVTSTRRSPPPPSMAARGGGFGAAVAFATGQRGPKRKTPGTSSTMVQLAGNKRMKVPNSKKAAVNMQHLAKKGGFSSHRP
eukprot:Nitzschia sp. Nitz4//scaffold38_size140716//105175//106377//NITZ4_003158-RA/size140716-exonerate_protein2genome-gene-0.109-mRNA-1//-1//CDS//3329550111//6527//frame0